jgi:hypothetical protein
MDMPYKLPYKDLPEEVKDKLRYKWRKYYYRNHDRLKKFYLDNYFNRRSTLNGLKAIRTANKRAESKRRFGIDRNIILNRFNHKCVFCGKNGNIIHHLDNKGRNTKEPNNELSNLVCCCHSCHALIHFHKKKLQMKI